MALAPTEVISHATFYLPFLAPEAMTVSTDAASTRDDFDQLIGFLNATAPEWHRPCNEVVEGTVGPLGDLDLYTYSKELMGELEHLLPRRIAERTVKEKAQCVGPAQDDRSGTEVPIIWKRQRLAVSMWNVGAGLLTATYQPIFPPGMTWLRYRDFLQAQWVEPKSSYSALISESYRAFLEAVRHVRGLKEDTSPWETARDGFLWVHALSTVKLPPDSDDVDRIAISKVLVPNGQSCGDDALDNVVLRLGVTSCVVGGSDQTCLVDAAKRLIGVHSACWGAAVHLDRVLFHHLTALQNEESLSLEELEQRAYDAVRIYEQARYFRSQLDTAPVHLQPVDRAIWDHLCQEWKLSSQLTSLDRKLEDLDHIYDHLTARLANRRTRRISDVLFVFTFASIVTVALTVIQFVDHGLGAPASVNGAIVVALMTVAILLWRTLARLTRAP